MDKLNELLEQNDECESMENLEPITYVSHLERFLSYELSDSKQYSSLYSSRLMELAPYALQNAKKLWGDQVDTTFEKSLISITHQNPIVIVGTLYKESKGKPTIMTHITAFNAIIESTKFTKILSDADYCVLEDRTARVPIKFQPPYSCNDYVSGLVLGIHGHMDKDGTLIACEVCTPNILQINTMRIDPTDFFLKPRRIAMLISDLNLGIPEMITKQEAFKQLLLDSFSKGGCFQKMQLIRIILVGGLIKIPTGAEKVVRGSYNLQKLNTLIYENVEKGLSYADEYIESLVKLAPFTIIPGRKDFGSPLLPQTPMPLSALSDTFEHLEEGHEKNLEFVSNPYKCAINEKNLIICSGQGVRDIMMYSKYDKDSTLNVLQKLYEWKHLFPTAPDTLRCQPIKDKDPLVLQEKPDLLAVGSQKQFGYERVDGISFVGVPKFKSGSFAIVDVDSMETYEMNIKAGLSTS